MGRVARRTKTHTLALASAVRGKRPWKLLKLASAFPFPFPCLLIAAYVPTRPFPFVRASKRLICELLGKLPNFGVLPKALTF